MTHGSAQGAPMTEARRLLERMIAAKDALDDPCGTCDLGIPGGECRCPEKINEVREGELAARAYLAMTTREGEQPTFNGSPISWATYRWLTAVYVRRVWDDRMQARVAREGELVAALGRIREQAAYGFTGETLRNMTKGMSAQEMNAWWIERITALCEAKA